ncbi:MAG: DUF2953 domain-containing protein [Lachnospiraceae bacterium]|nr:DUF2953 domain-containing protein [Lachnospiraceae bacterium]
MAVFLTVLKIIGIVLLVILGIILLLLALVLFVPVRYEAQGDVKDGNIKARLKGGWLLGILKIRGGFVKTEDEQTFALKAKIFGKTLVKAGSENGEPAGTSPPADIPEDPVLGDEYRDFYYYGKKDEEGPSGDEAQKPDDAKAPAKEEKKEGSRSGRDKKKEKQDKKEKKKRQKAERKAERKKKASEKKKDPRSLGDRISDRIDAISDKKDSIEDKIYGIIDKKDRVTDIFFSGENDKTFARISKNIKMVVRHLKPTYLGGYVRFGADDPYKTGMVYSASTLLYRFYDDSFEIRPDFAEKVLDADVKMKGRIRLIIPAKAFLSIYFSKKCRKLYRDIKSLKNQE